MFLAIFMLFQYPVRNSRVLYHLKTFYRKISSSVRDPQTQSNLSHSLRQAHLLYSV